ncbi:thioester-containing protein 1 allele S3-like [Anopheles moucheti]|uniref:thioester-containing protein 1 allele S3-like n=1 Tax=Anopheles moucheti TaxID=186751 RepID=UPI0022F00377|nr:thioester-containing protein 1 allele S3-like [Anopheles moucheti]
MWQFIRSRILTVIIFIGAAHGILVVGPKFIRANQDYTVVISNFNSNVSKVDLMLQMEGRSNDDRSVLNLTKTVDVRRNMNRMITFNMPADLVAGNYKIIVDGQRGFSFHKEAELVHLSKTITGLIQIDKPVYKPGDTVKFRVIVLDSELKPPARVKSIQVTIRDPQTNEIRKWSTPYAGVFEGDLQIASTPTLGTWLISALVDEEVVASKTFKVKEYVLSSFDVEVIPSVVPLEKDQGLTLTIDANYHFGKPVKGIAKFKVYLINGILDRESVFEVYGKMQVQLQFKDYFEVHEDRQDVLVKTTFIEHATNRTVVKQSDITVYKYKYGVELIKDSPQFRPGLPFKCALQFRYHDGTPAKGITGKVEVKEIGYETTATSDDEGLIKLELNPSDNVDDMNINFSDDDIGFFFEERVEKVDVVTNAYLKLELKSPVKLNQIVRLLVTCNERMSFFVFYVVSKGNIIDSGFIGPNNQKKYFLQLNATEMMIPKSKIIVATIIYSTVVYDLVDIDFKSFRNDISLSIDEMEVKPGHQIELRISGQAGAYVGLAAYAKTLQHYKTNHDPFWEDAMQVFEGFHEVIEDKLEMFHSTGLFGMIPDDIMIPVTHNKSARNGRSISNPTFKLFSYRTHFPESWLWQNVTIGRSGTRTLIESVPDTITSWYLTAFSIDPVHGFGIIKKPIQFTTIQPFYIVESLPYSIKRGEAVELVFTLFNNLGGEYIADVTLFNVANQTEFVGRPVEDKSYTKSVLVPPKIGVPVSFLVTARKLGEMTVRIEAKINMNQESDALEKVIRVMPESLVQSKMETRFFCFDTYTKRTFLMNLYINSQANSGSTKIKFRLNPNLATTVLNNLNYLLADPTGNAEDNMVKFVPNIMVLDYLHAIGSKDQDLINDATYLSQEGYRNQMRYRQTDGSFGVWQYGGSVFLTAFVAKSMQAASKYISEIDTAKVEMAYDWLASKQYYTGGFDEVGFVLYKDMQGGLRNGISLTSYVVTALLENENAKVKHAVVIQKAMNYLSRQVKYIEYSYDLSLVTYALMLNGHSMKDAALQKLLDKSTATNNGTERYWTTNSIETTAYALLSIVLAEKYLDGIPVMRWLVNQRYVTGSFPRTQDTFVGLKALTKLAEKISSSRNNYTLQLKFRNASRHFHINSQNNNIIHIKNLPEDTRSMEINVEGIGAGLLKMEYQYSLNLVNSENGFKLVLEKQNTRFDYELRLKVCASFIPKASISHSNMTLIEVNFPGGYIVDRNSIYRAYFEPTSQRNPMQDVDIRHNGTAVVVYYHSMGDEWTCFTATAYRQGYKSKKRTAYVIVSDYYNPNFYTVQLFNVSA